MGAVGERYTALKRAQKVPTGVPAYTLWVNRPLGRLVAAASPRWLGPNGLTALSGLITYGTLISLWVAPVGEAWTWVAGVLLALGFVLDSADGQLARLRGGGTAVGEWLDHVVDAGKIALLHMTVAVYFVRAGYDVAWLAWPALYLVVATLIYAGGLLVDKLRSSGRSTGPTAPSRVRAIAMLPVDYGLVCLAFVLLPWPTLFVAAYIALAVANALFGGAYMVKWVRELQRAA